MGTKEQIQAHVSYSRTWGCISDSLHAVFHLRQHVIRPLIVRENECDLVLQSTILPPSTHVIFFPHLYWSRWYGKGFRRNPSPVYSALMQTILHTHTHTALSDWHWRLSQAAGGVGRADNHCLMQKSHPEVTTHRHQCTSGTVTVEICPSLITNAWKWQCSFNCFTIALTGLKGMSRHTFNLLCKMRWGKSSLVKRGMQTHK